MIDSDSSFEQRRRIAGIEADTKRKRAELERNLVLNCLPLTGAALKTGATEDRLEALARQGEAIAIDRNGQLLFPSWQLNRNNELRPIYDGVRQLVDVFPGDIAVLNDWMNKPHPDLDDLPPTQALVEGRGVDVVVAASAIGAAGR